MAGYTELLTDAEKAQIEQGTIGIWRSRVVNEVAKLATSVGLVDILSADNIMQFARRQVLEMNETDLKRLQRSLSKSVQFLGGFQATDSRNVLSGPEDTELHEAPRHSVVATVWAERLGLDDDAITSLVSYLDPQGDMEMSDDKRAVVNKLVEYIEDQYGNIDNQSLALGPRQKVLIRKLLGAWYQQTNGEQMEREPMTVRSILVSDDERIQKVDVTLILDALESLANPFVEKKPETQIDTSFDKFMTRKFGESWVADLAIDFENVNIDSVADAILSAYPPIRKPNSIERVRRVIVGRLSGEKAADLASDLGISVATYRQILFKALGSAKARFAQTNLLSRPSVAVQGSSPEMVEAELTPDTGTKIKTEQLSMPELRQLLDLSLHDPSKVSSPEWEEAARTVFYEQSGQLFTDDEQAELWKRLHIDDQAKYADDITDVGRNALKKLQKRFFEVAKDKRLAKKAEQNVSLRVLLVMTKGVNTLDDVYEKLNSINPRITKNVAQRYAMDGVLEVLSD